ncbi:MAG: M23 family metallopeptidase [Desulfobacterales bacterium]
MKEKKKNIKSWIIAVGCCVLLVTIVWLWLVRFEGQKPTLKPDLRSPYIGRSHSIAIHASDVKSGLRRLWIAVLKDGKEVVLHDEVYPSAGFLKSGKRRETSVNLQIEPDKLGFEDGEAVLRMAVWDHSWRSWWKGNKTYLENKVTIDTRSPEIEIISRAHNLSQGGAGLVIFRTSEICKKSGVYLGDNFFPGHAGYYSDPNIFLAFIALKYTQGPKTKISVEAVDRAGNSTKVGIPNYIRRKVFRRDTINVSEGFLNRKLPEFSSEIPQDANLSAVDKFLVINRDLRKKDYQSVMESCNSSDAKIHWKGGFLRLPKSATRARFADHRTYTYKGREIDRQVHLGIDLASLTNSPVPAANGGIVVFADNIGIYGRTVILDHGLGLFSMYSHLSHIAVKPGDRLSKGQTIGRTGSTGLAGGDHLHFGMIVHNTFVNPVEWWDKNWIKNNVLSKIEQVETPRSQD